MQYERAASDGMRCPSLNAAALDKDRYAPCLCIIPLLL